MTTLVTATLGVICLAGGMTGYLVARANALQRLLLVAAAIVLIKPGLWTDAFGASAFALVLAWQLATARRLEARA